MLHFEFTRIVTAAVGALILSTSFVAAAIGPAATSIAAHAQADTVRANV